MIERGGAFEVLNFAIGRTNDEFCKLPLRCRRQRAPALEDLLEELLQFGCPRPTSRMHVRVTDQATAACLTTSIRRPTSAPMCALAGEWIEVERQRMDAVVVSAADEPSCRKLREVRSGERVVCGLEGIRVTPEFRDRERADSAS